MSGMFRNFLFLTLIAGATACNSSTSSNPSAGGPNPNSTTITVETSKGAPITSLPVILSTGFGAGGPTGIIDSERTNGGGQVTFVNLPRSGQLCVYAATQVGGIVYKVHHCASPFPARYILRFPKM